ncbi:aminoglycoside phosphotransferase family protein [Mesorhizobium sp. M1005]|uniref:phosphotransferase n=1 Tax=unclassified Mesorhizobium TaxID=325217 RepID=UPI00333C6F5B
MKAEERTTVLVDGGTVNPTPFSARQLAVKPLVSLSDLDDGGARALIVLAGALPSDEGRLDLVKRLRRLAASSAQRGILVIVVTKRGEEAIGQAVARSGAGVLAQWQEHTGVVLRQLAVLPDSDWDNIAETCARCRCGPSLNSSLAIRDKNGNELPTPLLPELKLLFRRAFHDYSGILISEENGGKSSSSIWKVETEGLEQHTPFIVKSGPAAVMEEHINTYRDVVADRVPYRGCAPLCLDRCVVGSEHQLAVSRFVENAVRLDKVVINRDVKEVIQAIYRTVLGRWRKDPERKRLDLLQEFLPAARHDAYLKGLERTYDKLTKDSYAGASPRSFFVRLAGLQAEEHPVCRAHDDLNLRNVFVCGGDAEAVLIDFTRAARRPLSHDVARLEIGLAFDAELQADQPLPEQVLEDFYSRDLFAMSLKHLLQGKKAQYRLNAIVALRTTILEEGQSHSFDLRREYTIAICVGLLYYAKGKSPDAAIAYKCAVDLLDRVTNPSLW